MAKLFFFTLRVFSVVVKQHKKMKGNGWIFTPRAQPLSSSAQNYAAESKDYNFRQEKKSTSAFTALGFDYSRSSLTPPNLGVFPPGTCNCGRSSLACRGEESYTHTHKEKKADVKAEASILLLEVCGEKR